jgi:hypothetical protein
MGELVGGRHVSFSFYFFSFLRVARVEGSARGRAVGAFFFFFSSCGVDGGLASGRAAGAERPDASSTVFRILIFQLQL